MPPDTNIKEDIDYDSTRTASSGDIQTPNPNHTSFDGRRVVIIPIVKEDQYDSGRERREVRSLRIFFLQTKVGSGNGGDLVAEYIDDIVLGQGSFDPNGRRLTV